MAKQLKITIDQYSIAGVKPVNQDYLGYKIPEGPQLATKGIAVALADGISSSDVSQIASQTSVKNFLDDYYCTSDTWSVKKAGLTVLDAANSWLYAQTQYSPYKYNKDKGYVCTFCGLILKSNTAHIFHAGDTRVYRIAGSYLEQLTDDHRTIISSAESYLARALGMNSFLEADYRSINVEQGDMFLLATDGVHEFISDKVLVETLKNTDDWSGLAKQLVEQALENGSDDNLSLQIIRVDQLPDKNLDELQAHIHDTLPPDTLRPRMNFDGYNILRELYISSRSHVFLAEDTDTHEQVVIKTPSAELRNDEEFLERLLMEDWIAKRINNAHVMKAINSPRKRNYLYTVTEYVDGITLSQWMIDNPDPEIETVRNIIEQIAKGLQAFHRQEMIHQDLRPHNIMIDLTGTVKIIDFGATKVAGVSEVASLNEGIMGTSQFTAPELYLGYESSNLSDIFSLGVIAYQMLSGRLPYGNDVARSDAPRAQQKLHYQSLSILNPKVPGWLDYAIGKAVSVNPLKRYEEVSEFIYEMHRPSDNYIHQKNAPLMARNPVAFWQATSAVLMVVIVVLLANGNFF